MFDQSLKLWHKKHPGTKLLSSAMSGSLCRPFNIAINSQDFHTDRIFNSAKVVNPWRKPWQTEPHAESF